MKYLICCVECWPVAAFVYRACEKQAWEDNVSSFAFTGEVERMFRDVAIGSYRVKVGANLGKDVNCIGSRHGDAQTMVGSLCRRRSRRSVRRTVFALCHASAENYLSTRKHSKNSVAVLSQHSSDCASSGAVRELCCTISQVRGMYGSARHPTTPFGCSKRERHRTHSLTVK